MNPRWSAGLQAGLLRSAGWCAGLQAGILWSAGTFRSAGILLITLIATACASGSPPATQDVPGPPPAMELPANTTGDSEAIRPFTIDVPDAVLDDLRLRLQQTRLPDQLPGTGWDYGTERAYLTELLAYWRDEFDWRAQEAMLNQFDQYRTAIDGLDVHFIHQRSRHEDALPLVITHGWPGSVMEFHKIIGPLTDPTAHGGDAADAFHVIAPSIPGYGFSDKPTERGYSPEKMAEIIGQLVERLGYDRYGVQGGDWGSIISRWQAAQHPDRVVGVHINMVTAGPPPGADPTEGVPREEMARFQARNEFWQGEQAYLNLQGTKPQTLGYGLNDSPAGLAAWIVEKFHTWCDCNGDIESRFTKDELLTNITIYWATQTMTSSTRIYYESRRATSGTGYIEVPVGCAIFPGEIFLPPRAWVEASHNVTRWTEMPEGGHFAALEQPELLTDDIRAFFRDLR